jgi:hypothetical protein
MLIAFIKSISIEFFLSLLLFDRVIKWFISAYLFGAVIVITFAFANIKISFFSVAVLFVKTFPEVIAKF